MLAFPLGITASAWKRIKSNIHQSKVLVLDDTKQLDYGRVVLSNETVKFDTKNNLLSDLQVLLITTFRERV